jgi:hypothetical protein
MSDLFLKNNFKNNNNITESSIGLSNIIGMNNNRSNKNMFSATSPYMNGGYASVTSSANLSKINTNDINNLLSMLTSESEVNSATSELENTLKNMLVQDGGAALTENTEELEGRLINMLGQTGGSDDISTEALENRINSIINGTQSGGAKSLLTLAGLTLAGTMLNKKLSAKTSTETETEFNSTRVIGPVVNKPVVPVVNTPVVPVVNKPVAPVVPKAPEPPANKIKVNVEVPLDSVTSSEMPNKNVNSLSETSTNSVFVKQPAVVAPNPFIPLTTTTVNNNSEFSATSSAMPDKRVSQLVGGYSEQEGGANPGMRAFLEISAMVAKKLNIANGVPAKKIAGQLQRDVKEKNEGISGDKLVEAAKKHLEDNLEKYKKMT